MRAQRLRKRTTAIALALGMTTAIVPSLLASGPAAARSDRPARWSGSAAVARLGDRIADVAAKHGHRGDELRDELLEDPTLKVDSTDSLLYVEPTVVAGVPAPATPLSTTIPDGDTFLLHSKPGANRVIFLDFDGHLLSGTAWNSGLGGDCYAEPFDNNANPAFSTAELGIVKSVWRRVADDYAPFDVDVTTEDPGYAAINRSSSSDLQFGTRALITNSVTPCSNGQTVYSGTCGSCGGVAYVGVYDNTGYNHDYYQPALVFQNGVTDNAKYVAEATSHEVGHNIGLSHDGATTGCGSTGTSACPYYYGHGNWAPIMGVGYGKAMVQWSKGEYANASQTQDDFVVAQSNGLPLRADDHGDSAATATVLAAPSGSATGVISTRADVDVFSVTVGAGPATFTATPAPLSPDLDIRLTLRNSAGTVIATGDPAFGATGYDSPTGLGASVTATLVAGTYTVTVDGVGYGTASTAYTDYASLGNYTITSSAATPGPNSAPTAVASATPTSGTAPLTVSLSAAGSSDPEGGPLTYDWSFGDGTPKGSGATVSHVYSAAGSYTATLTITDPAGATATATVDITVSAPMTIDIAGLVVTGVRNSSTKATATATVTVRDANGAAVSGASVTGQWFLGTKLLSTRTVTTVTSGAATSSSSSQRASAGQVFKFCVTGLTKSGQTWSPTLFAPTTATDCATWVVA